MNIEIRYLGTSAFQITSERGVKLLIDPCLTGHLGRNISPVNLDEVRDSELILVTHGAGDHMGDTLELAKTTGCTIICGPGVSYYLGKQGIDRSQILPLVWGGERYFKGLTIRCVETKHVSFIQTENGVITGLPLGFIVYTESNVGIYHPGDTSIFSDIRLFAELYRPEIGLLPVGGFPGAFPELTAREAAMVAQWMKLKVAIPMHYDIEDPTDAKLFAQFARHESPSTRVIILEPGQRLFYNPWSGQESRVA